MTNKNSSFLLAITLIPMLQSNETNPNGLLREAIEALNRNLDFILDNLDDMNVDGLLGVNIARAHLQKTIPKIINNFTLEIKLNYLIYKSELTWQKQRSNIPDSPEKYRIFNNYVIPTRYWEKDINYTYGQLKSISKINSGPYNVNRKFEFKKYVINSEFDERKSDDCLIEVATAGDYAKPHRCPVSPTCKDNMMTIPTNFTNSFPGYGITHMLIFLQVAFNSGCIINRHLLNNLTITECSYILWELEKNVEYGYIQNLNDLLLEQITVCGHEGFTEFLKLSYLEYVIEVQDPHGCYGHILSKRKREVVEMKYGCNSHTTGLAASVLALFIRFIIETNSTTVL